MRGNHVQLGRQDYAEPEQISPADRAVVESCKLVPRPGSKLWFDVYRAGMFIGSVANYLCGQVFRPIDCEAGDYLYAVSDWNSQDPKYGKAILLLLESQALPYSV